MIGPVVCKFGVSGWVPEAIRDSESDLLAVVAIVMVPPCAKFQVALQPVQLKSRQPARDLTPAV